jgi:4a-hydroxytetrahydrobiopterin dehydratase
MDLKEMTDRMNALNEWTLEGDAIIKVRKFGTYGVAREFVHKITEIAEKWNHHPVIVWKYLSVKLVLTTHEFGKVSERDFDMAEEIDKL